MMTDEDIEEALANEFWRGWTLACGLVLAVHAATAWWCW